MPFNDTQQLHILMSIAGVTVKEYMAVTAQEGEEFFRLASYQALAKTAGTEAIRTVVAKMDAALPGMEKTLNILREDGITVLIKGGKGYPDILNCLHDAPYILYLKGNIQLLSRPLITVVGSRRCTRYGEIQTELIVRGLTENGFCIVSGLAEGIDTIAACSAFKYGGDAVCVIAGGFRQVYPKSNLKLFDRHAQSGLAVSEYPPLSVPLRYMFPARNRIMAALSQGVVLTEAGVKSGALITANLAIEMGKNLFVLPGNVNSEASRGCNLLLKEAQAAIITDYTDILLALGITDKAQRRAKGGSNLQLTGVEREVAKLLKGGDLHFDEIAAKLVIDAPHLATLLSVLEIKGIIKKLAGNFYGVTAQFA